MKVVSLLKKNKLLVIVTFVYGILFIAMPDKAIQSVNNSVYYLIEMIQIMPVVFLLTVVIEALVPKEMIMKGFGDKSGIKGNVFALILGSISAGPIYAAFPISKALLGKGASISNVVIILSSWAVIKVPMLANEAKFLGVEFMAVRWVLTVIAIFAMAYTMNAIVKKKDLPVEENQKAGTVMIKEEYCIGCGICVKLSPNHYKMKNNKAVVVSHPEGQEAIKAVLNSVEKCPSDAISFSKDRIEKIA